MRLHVFFSEQPLGPPPRLQPPTAPFQRLEGEICLPHVHRVHSIIILIIVVIVIDRPVDPVLITTALLLLVFIVVIVVFIFILVVVLVLVAGLLLIALGGQVSRRQAAVAPFVPSQPARRGVILGVGGDESPLDQHLREMKGIRVSEGVAEREGGMDGVAERKGERSGRDRGGEGVAEREGERGGRQGGRGLTGAVHRR